MEPSLGKAEAPQPENSAQNQERPVSTYNEWDPLKEVTVGRLEYATIPNNRVLFTRSLPATAAKLYRPIAGRLYPKLILEPHKRSSMNSSTSWQRKGSPFAAPTCWTSQSLSRAPTGGQGVFVLPARETGCL